MITPSCPQRKTQLARVLADTPWTALVKRVEKRLPYLRVVNYHGVPAALEGRFVEQLDYLLERFEPVPAVDLETMLEEGPRGRPAIAFTFDDGLANHFDVVAPALERRGLTAVFAVPAVFPSLPRSEQASWHRAHVYRRSNEEHKSDEDRRALSWDQIHELARRGHRICSHSLSHIPLDESVPVEVLEREIVGARAELESCIGEGVLIDGWVWPGPVPYTPAPEAVALVRKTYAVAFQGDPRPLYAGHDPHLVCRTNLEASWPLHVVDFQLSGAVELYGGARRLRRLVMHRRPFAGAG